MKTPTKTMRRSATAAVLLIGGGAVSAAVWIGGDHGLAVGLIIFYIVAAGIAFVWSGGQGDVAAIMRAGGDERQRKIDRDAIALSAYAMGGVALIGTIVQAARGQDPGGYGVMCLVGGTSYSVALFFFNRSR